MASHSKTMRNFIGIFGRQPGHEVLQAVLDVELARVENVRRDLSGWRHQADPEAAPWLDIDDYISCLNLQEGVLTEVVNMRDDIASLDDTVHTTIDNIESGHTLEERRLVTTVSFMILITSSLIQILESEYILLQ